MVPMSVTEDWSCGVMLALARQSIASAFGRQVSLSGAELSELKHLQMERACFVTLESRSRLRGCIGSLYPGQSLEQDLRHNAVQAAFHDPRFKPLENHEPIRIKVSVLSPMQEMNVRDEADLLQQLRPEQDGLLIQVGAHRATFLPDVWESLTAPDEFLAALKQKAGVAARPLTAGELKAWRYTTQRCAESGEVPIG